VTGTIDGGSGINWLEHQRTGTATVTLGGALPTGFSVRPWRPAARARKSR
jgi:hypothetical protein